MTINLIIINRLVFHFQGIWLRWQLRGSRTMFVYVRKCYLRSWRISHARLQRLVSMKRNCQVWKVIISLLVNIVHLNSTFIYSECHHGKWACTDNVCPVNTQCQENEEFTSCMKIDIVTCSNMHLPHINRKVI